MKTSSLNEKPIPTYFLDEIKPKPTLSLTPSSPFPPLPLPPSLPLRRISLSPLRIIFIITHTSHLNCFPFFSFLLQIPPFSLLFSPFLLLSFLSPFFLSFLPSPLFFPFFSISLFPPPHYLLLQFFARGRGGGCHIKLLGNGRWEMGDGTTNQTPG